MKFWQLESICINQGLSSQLMSELQKCDETKFYDWHLNFDNLVEQQDRDKLDYILPETLCISVLNLIPAKIYRSKESLRADKLLKPCVEMTFTEAYLTYGSSALEDIHEKSSYPLGWIK